MWNRNVVVAAALFVAACSSTTESNDRGASLTLVEPGDQTLERGETNQIMVAINRDNFSGPVTIRFENLPRGVTVVEPNPTIPAGERVKRFTLRADVDAAVVENHRVVIRADGADGLMVTEAFNVTVKAR
ncbi:MAG TPA: hypothetical protein VEI02_10965 [Planctomycetota bacterium]|nr:hypothetical protein [Planctomycetota bacterium]